MDGPLPLDYDVKDRNLVVNKTETVRHIYLRHQALGSVRLFMNDLSANGIVNANMGRV